RSDGPRRRARVVEPPGVGALAVGPRRRTLGTSLRSALGRPEPAGRHVPFAPGSKRVLEGSLRIAVGRGDRHIAAPHLLLALLSRPGTVCEVLADHGVTYEAAESGLTGP
ncbi:Clp protease N-terminal domain-containing protein, partial [Streptomyces goshikiensis]|uniref:Clp protease N-terminal domain-containing protein n=1 Tax=Streptomyces goshikiensis TaxID=1942 RepID=UPI003329C00A